MVSKLGVNMSDCIEVTNYKYVKKVNRLDLIHRCIQDKIDILYLANEILSGEVYDIISKKITNYINILYRIEKLRDILFNKS
jgi:hypothetical protein